VPAGHRRYVADHIQGARYVELAGADELMWAGDQDALVGEIQEFVTGARPVAEPDRVLATILFTDIVGSTRLAAEHGDRAWRELLERHHALVRSELARFRGREVDTAGDGSSRCSTDPAAPSGVRPPRSGACSRSESRSGPAFTPARSRRSATGSGASLSTSVPVCRPSRAQVRSSSARRCATWSQGRVCNSKTVVPASSRVCPTHGRFSRS